MGAKNNDSYPDRSEFGFRTGFLRFAATLDRLTYAVCMVLLVTIFATQTFIVTLRYLFAIGFVELQNLVTYGFAAFCVLVVPLALRSNDHVRVDIFQSKLDPKSARAADIIAIIVFLAPVFILTLWYAMPLVLYSWSIFEGSRDVGGLPGYFVVLTALPTMCILMIVQGFAIILDKNLIHVQPKNKAV